jgi:autonomous glycyl radical cofactor GrcA
MRLTNKLTNTERVLKLFKASNGVLISNSQIIAGQFYGSTPIAAWSARISDARVVLGCTCGEHDEMCTASEHIRNVKKNWYQYTNDVKPVVKVESEAHVNIRDLEKRINDLINEYNSEPNEWKRSLIKVRGTALRRSLEIEKSNEKVTTQIMENLL